MRLGGQQLSYIRHLGARAMGRPVGQQWTGLVMLSKHQNYRMIRRIRYNVMCNVKRQQFNIIINSNKVRDGGGSVDVGGDLREARQVEGGEGPADSPPILAPDVSDWLSSSGFVIGCLHDDVTLVNTS